MSGGDDPVAMLCDQASRLFYDLIDRELLISVERGGHPAALADAVEAFGLAEALTIGPEDGGLSFGDVPALFALLGYYAVPLPIGETMLARCALARAGIAAPTGSIGLAKGGEDLLSVGFRHAHLVVNQGNQLILIQPDAGAGQAQTSISRQPRALVDLEAATVIAEAAWPRTLPDALALGAMLRASEIAGAVARVLALSVEYANLRQQFGRPIGRFQAVQQLLAKLAAEAAAARSAADIAWVALDAGSLGYAAAIAKIRTGEAARAAAAIAHQVHGAIGVTDEHILHYFTRRLWEWRLDFGSEGFWAERLGRAARETEGGLWHFLVTRCGIPASTTALS